MTIMTKIFNHRTTRKVTVRRSTTDSSYNDLGIIQESTNTETFEITCILREGLQPEVTQFQVAGTKTVGFYKMYVQVERNARSPILIGTENKIADIIIINDLEYVAINEEAFPAENVFGITLQRKTKETT